MRKSALICLLFVSQLAVMRLFAQSAFSDPRSECGVAIPETEGGRIRYAATIEMPKAYLSGICVLLREGNVVRGSLFNEFGVTALDFTYHPENQIATPHSDHRSEKVKLHHVISMMDKWYIRRVLRKDLAQLMLRLQQGETTYHNERRHITYQLKVMDNG